MLIIFNRCPSSLSNAIEFAFVSKQSLQIIGGESLKSNSKVNKPVLTFERF